MSGILMAAVTVAILVWAGFCVWTHLNYERPPWTARRSAIAVWWLGAASFWVLCAVLTGSIVWLTMRALSGMLH